MSKKLETNGQTRKTLASQLDRLDGILDGLTACPGSNDVMTPRPKTNSRSIPAHQHLTSLKYLKQSGGLLSHCRYSLVYRSPPIL